MPRPNFQEMWDAFVATVKDKGDGSQSCEAEIQTTDLAGTTVTYYGSTANGHGHAEIDALFQCLTNIGWSAGAFANLQVTVSCTAKPCCKFCSAIMGNLGIGALDGTFKSTKSMGISYALPYQVRTFLKNVNACTEADILAVYSG